MNIQTIQRFALKKTHKINGIHNQVLKSRDFARI